MYNEKQETSIIIGMEEIVRVGVSIIAKRDSDQRLIVGKRIGSHGADTWALPGGHLEYGESFEACASRELYEETGIFLSPSQFTVVDTLNCIMPEYGKHHVTIILQTVLPEDCKPQVKEPNKCKEWRLVYWNQIQSLGELFIPLRRLLEVRAV